MVKNPERLKLHIVPTEPPIGLESRRENGRVVVTVIDSDKLPSDPRYVPNRSRGPLEQIPIVSKAVHLAITIAHPRDIWSNVITAATSKRIVLGKLEVEGVPKFVNDLQQGQAKYAVLDAVGALATEVGVLAANGPLAILSLVFSENPIFGLLTGVALGVVAQGLIRNTFYIPRTMMELQAYKSIPRTPEELEFFWRVHSRIFWLLFVPGVGSGVLPVTSILRNRDLVEDSMPKMLKRVVGLDS